ncbi:hypothetical protein L195_g012067 [Trifolium pratense]|uniref:Uncharacterized protein n=1 Tax=Trifolium pratense TaxID=57577 RepID=A0A2K3PJA9_TRIPR|nr:hypothetical protein L195_g012067 [Trifolium pratense]
MVASNQKARKLQISTDLTQSGTNARTMRIEKHLPHHLKIHHQPPKTNTMKQIKRPTTHQKEGGIVVGTGALMERGKNIRNRVKQWPKGGVSSHHEPPSLHRKQRVYIFDGGEGAAVLACLESEYRR